MSADVLLLGCNLYATYYESKDFLLFESDAFCIAGKNAGMKILTTFFLKKFILALAIFRERYILPQTENFLRNSVDETSLGRQAGCLFTEAEENRG